MRIAVVSTDKTRVNEHFGKATRFLIYDLEASGPKLVEERPVTPLSTGDPDHPFDPAAFAKLVDALRDCQRVYCTKIGDKPTEELKKAGIEPVVYEGAIDAIIV